MCETKKKKSIYEELSKGHQARSGKVAGFKTRKPADQTLPPTRGWMLFTSDLYKVVNDLAKGNVPLTAD